MKHQEDALEKNTHIRDPNWTRVVNKLEKGIYLETCRRCKVAGIHALFWLSTSTSKCWQDMPEYREPQHCKLPKTEATTQRAAARAAAHLIEASTERRSALAGIISRHCKVGLPLEEHGGGGSRCRCVLLTGGHRHLQHRSGGRHDDLDGDVHLLHPPPRAGPEISGALGETTTWGL
jgi:hypothetical protein